MEWRWKNKSSQKKNTSDVYSTHVWPPPPNSLLLYYRYVYIIYVYVFLLNGDYLKLFIEKFGRFMLYIHAYAYLHIHYCIVPCMCDMSTIMKIFCLKFTINLETVL